MSKHHKNSRSSSSPPYLWQPGVGPDTRCLETMRDQFRCTAEPMGEAWFMGDRRRMFDYLRGNLDDCALEQLTQLMGEIASGNSCFGQMQEWTVWYRYLLAQLIPRHAERSYESLFQHLVAAFIAVHPRGIDEVYAGFADDAMQTLGRCLMDTSRWIGDQLAAPAPEDPFAGGRGAAFEWDVACGDFSAAMFLCAKYLPEHNLDSWLGSVFAIRCPKWTTQLYCWLLDAYPLLSGRVPELAKLAADAQSEVVWHGAHVLKGDYSGIYTPDRQPLPLLSPSRCDAVLAAATRHVSEASYFAWLDEIKQYAYLEASLGNKPSRFAALFAM